MAYKIISFFIRLIIRLIARVELSGQENLPAAKGYVIASNHIGRLDAALVYYALDRPDIIMLIAEKYRKNAFWRWLAKQLDGIFIDRFNPDLRALREAMKRLQHGGVLAVAPEGTRSKTGTLIEAKPGGIYLAWKSGVPILPVAVTGTQDAVVKERLTHLKRLQIKVTLGAAFTLPQEAKGKDREALLQEYTDEVMCRIAALMPEEMRGVYVGHPRLKELL
ncbi:MAG: lysophospholipid acyltransferase family protein [Anaerolineales bacterium]|nr:lysophospholipid acyltransferase family protein [Anaerolineales bacterium]